MYRFECPVCASRFSSHEGFIGHLKYHVRYGAVITRKKMKERKTLVCEVCRRKFKNVNGLAKHKFVVRQLSMNLGQNPKFESHLNSHSQGAWHLPGSFL